MHVLLELKFLFAAFGAGEGPQVHVRLEVDGQVREVGVRLLCGGAAFEGAEFIKSLPEQHVP